MILILLEHGNYQKGEICEIGRFFESDESLVNSCKNISSEMNIKVGTIASADLFLTNKEKAKEIRNEFGADCVEMEGAAIAQVCFLDNIPFLVIRGISDTPNGNNGIDFHTYLKLAAKNSVQILKKILV